MNNREKLLKINKQSVERINVEAIKRILIVYGCQGAFIGDTCVYVAQVRRIKACYFNASIDINALQRDAFDVLCAVAQHNPYIHQCTNHGLEDTRFEEYDLIICTYPAEAEFTDFYVGKYAARIELGETITPVLSPGAITGFDGNYYAFSRFPMSQQLLDFRLSPSDEKSILAHELFIADEERNWAESWLFEQGVDGDDEVYVFLDTSSKRDKILKLTDYFDIFSALIERPRVKALIFDEKNVGKSVFYKEWIGPRLADKLVVAAGRSLRQAIALVASRRVKLIFGPSTGLLHCASGALNILLQRQLIDRLPVMIAYFGGMVSAARKEDRWWKHSCADAIFPVKNNLNQLEIMSLKNADFKQLADESRLLELSDLTAKQMLAYIDSTYSMLLGQR